MSCQSSGRCLKAYGLRGISGDLGTIRLLRSNAFLDYAQSNKLSAKDYFNRYIKILLNGFVLMWLCPLIFVCYIVVTPTFIHYFINLNQIP